MDDLVEKALADFADGKLDRYGILDDIEMVLGHSPDDDDLESAIRSSFAPENIVNSAEAYDNGSWVEWLYYRTGADFVKTPNGAVVLSVDKMRSVRVPEETKYITQVADPEFETLHPSGSEEAVFSLRTTFAVDPDFEVQHPRGQTGPETNAGSFAPKEGGSRRQELEAEADRLRTVEGVAVPKVAREEDLARAVTLGQQADTAAHHLETLLTNIIQEGGEVESNEETPSSWDGLSDSQQETVAEDWKSANKDSARESAYELWRESDAYADARTDEAKEKVDEDEDTQESLVLAGLHAAAKSLKIPDHSDEEILDQLDLGKDVQLTTKSLEDPNVLRGLRELFGLPEYSEEQLMLIPHNGDFLPLFLDVAKAGYNDARTAAVEDAESDIDPDPPDDWLDDAVSNELETMWNDMEDTDRWDWAEKHLDNLGPEVESRKLEEPNTWKVDKDGVDYERTGAVGRALALARYAELSGDSAAKGGALARQIWTAWKSSSTSAGGLALQYYAAQVLGGHHRLTDDQQASARNWARIYGGDSGEDNVRAYVRAQWESTQFLLRKAEEQEVDLYRAVMLSEEELGGRNVFRVGGPNGPQYTELPDLALKQSGAASTSTNLGVCNAWNGVGAKPANPQRVVLRARVPATSVISLPAYGQNVHEETEWVVLGTPWYGWDAWLGKAPSFDAVPSDHTLKASHFQVQRVAMIDFNDPRQTGVGHWLWQRPRRFAWDEAQHPRGEKGTEQGGRFVAKAETLRAEDPHQTVWQDADPLRTHYGMLLVNPHERTILLREPTNHFQGYVWTFARGMPAPDEHPLDTALRETQEELGYDAEVQGLLPTVYRGASWASCYYVATPIGDQRPTDWETSQTRWATYEDARRLIGLTRNVIGRARDLRVLDDVFAQMDSRGRGRDAAFADFTLAFAIDPEFETKHPRDPKGQWADKPGGPEPNVSGGSSIPTPDPQQGGFEAMRQNMIERFGMTPEQANAQIVGMQQLTARLAGPTKATPTNEQARGTRPGFSFPGQCYEMAGRYMLDHIDDLDATDYTLVHGVIDQSPFGDMRIGHGWVETADGKVFDATTQEWSEKESYYKTFNAVSEQRYSAREARRMIFSKENWGCWHASAGVVNNQMKTPRRSRQRAKVAA